MTKHRMTGTPTYGSWQAMKSRCNNPNDIGYPLYGGSGVTICDRWQNSFENFYADMGERPAGKTLDRIDNQRGYSPDNCRWATPKEQMQNIWSSPQYAHLWEDDEPEPEPEPREVQYTITQAAAILGKAARTIRQAVEYHDEIGTRIGSLWVLTDDDLVKLRAMRRGRPAAPPAPRKPRRAKPAPAAPAPAQEAQP